MYNLGLKRITRQTIAERLKIQKYKYWLRRKAVKIQETYANTNLQGEDL